ncbi:PAS domain S-box-containing protein/diguanylate cyclase (GGDEF) domain-containing protein [Malonomonas rubra DSM 5091]|uniref:PAS domain S-box-containing protein/diguanylate cyclase (GGDEF) domain-containing protein n=1 Tax=Malonomonas rubra DSM 5091 TaxID=1122189 RepID=A0A1M6DWP7_MALRU|nr:diguanylate cyclase [Malonomonas rubra]SHI77549.1 PAS domain S-box-containing protein/diguanylate cyclase (GGDEF) domain-containing protein [Malonomonas rubra DSM 5091]
MSAHPISKVRRNISLLLLTLLLLSWGYFALSFSSDHRTIQKQSGQNLQSLALGLEIHTVQIVDLIDSLMQEMIRHCRQGTEQELQGLFGGWLLRYPAFSSLAIIDVDTGAALFSLNRNTDSRSFDAKAAFSFNDSSDLLQISDSLFYDDSGRAQIALSRIFERPAQKLRVVTLLYTDFVLDLHHDPEQSMASTIALYHENGMMLAQRPEGAGMVGRSFAETSLFKMDLAASRSGLTTDVGRLEGNRRIMAYRKLPELPLVVTVGVTKNQIFYDWQHRFLSYLFFQLMVTAGIISSLILQARALTRAQVVELDLEEREEHFRAVANSSVDAVISVSSAERIRFWSQGAEQTFCCSHSEALNMPISCFLQFAEKGRPLTLKQLASKDSPWMTDQTLEVQGQRKNGELFPTELSLSCGTVSGRPLYTLIVRDITERRQMEERARRMASHDSLTGLPNRALLIDRLQVAMAQIRRQGGQFALLFVDLDQFKPVNDTFGHEAGDRLLQQVAKRMQSTMRESDTVARIGGDEFAVLLQNVEDQAAVRQACEHLLIALRQKFNISSKRVSISCSIGAVLYHGQDSTASDLIGLADNAMYDAKRAGKNRFAFARI